MYSSLGPPTLSMASSKRYSFFIMMFASKYFEQTDVFFEFFVGSFLGGTLIASRPTLHRSQKISVQVVLVIVIFYKLVKIERCSSC